MQGNKRKGDGNMQASKKEDKAKKGKTENKQKVSQIKTTDKEVQNRYKLGSKRKPRRKTTELEDEGQNAEKIARRHQYVCEMKNNRSKNRNMITDETKENQKGD